MAKKILKEVVDALIKRKLITPIAKDNAKKTSTQLGAAAAVSAVGIPFAIPDEILSLMPVEWRLGLQALVFIIGVIYVVTDKR